jgi:hypothetical protein
MDFAAGALADIGLAGVDFTALAGADFGGIAFFAGALADIGLAGVDFTTLAGAFADLFGAGFVAAFFAGALVATFLATGLPTTFFAAAFFGTGFFATGFFAAALGAGLLVFLAALAVLLAGFFTATSGWSSILRKARSCESAKFP